jgi:hypothetical protein
VCVSSSKILVLVLVENKNKNLFELYRGSININKDRKEWEIEHRAPVSDRKSLAGALSTSS